VNCSILPASPVLLSLYPITFLMFSVLQNIDATGTLSLTPHHHLFTLIQCHSPMQTTCQDGKSTSCTKWASFLLLVTHTTTNAPIAARLGIGRSISCSAESHLYLDYELWMPLGKDTGSNLRNRGR